MTEHLVVVEDPEHWKPHYPEIPVMAARDYLSRGSHARARGLRVVNLCGSYRYLSLGYYCSLLAEARGHRVIPSVRTINDLSRRSIYRLDLADLHPQLQRSLERWRGEEPVDALDLDIWFGQCAESGLRELARQLFDVFRAPLLCVEMRRQGGRWRIQALKTLALHTLSAVQEEAFLAALGTFLGKRWQRPRARSLYRYDLAVLHNPREVLPPSDARTLKHFVRVGKECGVNVELIQRRDYGRLAEFDALFIRETTGIDHHTYQFAKKAEREGMVVMDDPDSILRCTNKVYLEELLRAHRVPTPRTVILGREDLDSVESLERTIAYPIVLKIPDGSFSRGVVKVEGRAELLETAAQLLATSELILAQEFLYTEFDWRVGVLDRKVIFVCQYYMSKRHWQIVNHGRDGRFKEGGYKTLRPEQAPEAVLKTGLRAADLIGDGLYGVDLKQTPRGVVVIEVNDNPNIDAGVEDGMLKDALYRIVMESFIARLERKRRR